MTHPVILPLAQVDRTWKPTKEVPLAQRLWRRVGVDENGCWIWVGVKRRDGYGWIRVDGIARPVHRLSYEALVGPIPPGLQIDHLCRVTSCCNPEHLEPVTPRVNSLRSESPLAKNARKTHCPQGHRYAGDNLIVRYPPSSPNGNRVCRACETARLRERSRMLRERRLQDQRGDS